MNYPGLETRLLSELTRALDLKLVGVADTLRAAENRLDLMYLTFHEKLKAMSSGFQNFGRIHPWYLIPHILI